MAETVNISQMAEKISDTIFKEFFWEKDGPTNTNWKCENEHHDVKTHPSDVVFFYDEPYASVRRYFQCDLKSYAKKSIGKNSIGTALESLAMQVACAEISDEWQEKFLHSGKTAEISGLLFVYNHDKEYDAEFKTCLEGLDASRLKMPKRSRLYVLGPDDINWFDRVCHGIKLLRGDEKIPPRDQCQFHHPDLITKANAQQSVARAATIEMLTSPWIVMRYSATKQTGGPGIIIFVRRETTVHYFKYIIDYLRIFQILERDELRISIMTNEDLGRSKINMQKAITEYLDDAGETSSSELSKRLNGIDVGRVPLIETSFSEDEIGMGYER